MLEWMSTGDGDESIDECGVEPWPWHSAEVQQDDDGTWSAWLTDALNEDCAAHLGRYGTKLRAKVTVEAVLAKLESNAWVIAGSDDFGAVTRISRSLTFDAVMIDGHVEALVE